MKPEREQEIRDEHLYCDANVNCTEADLIREIDSLRQEHERLKEENLWIRTKLKLEADAPITKVQGALHVVCHSDESLTNLVPIWDKQQKEYKQTIDSLSRQVNIAVEALERLDSNFDFDPRAQAIIEKALSEIAAEKERAK